MARSSKNYNNFSNFQRPDNNPKKWLLFTKHEKFYVQ